MRSFARVVGRCAALIVVCESLAIIVFAVMLSDSVWVWREFEGETIAPWRRLTSSAVWMAGWTMVAALGALAASWLWRGSSWRLPTITALASLLVFIAQIAWAVSCMTQAPELWWSTMWVGLSLVVLAGFVLQLVSSESETSQLANSTTI